VNLAHGAFYALGAYISVSIARLLGFGPSVVLSPLAVALIEAAGRPLTGKLEVRDFQLVEAPILAKLLTFAGLTGIVDLLSGQGIHFTALQMPFAYQDGILQVRDGEAAGNALGITAKGRIDLDNDQLALEGTLVPAYVLNSALSGLPLVGGLFSAEKGGGVVAINYQIKGPMDDPGYSVNPLSALTPGFLRGFFDLFGGTAPKN